MINKISSCGSWPSIADEDDIHADDEFALSGVHSAAAQYDYLADYNCLMMYRIVDGQSLIQLFCRYIFTCEMSVLSF